MRDAGWALAAAALYVYGFTMTMEGRTSGALGVLGVAVALIAQFGIKSRVLRLSFLVSGALLFAFTYLRFTESVWAGVIFGLLMLGGIFYNDRKGKKK